ncbi:unnamed protein product [Lota lota]
MRPGLPTGLRDTGSPGECEPRWGNWPETGPSAPLHHTARACSVKGPSCSAIQPALLCKVSCSLGSPGETLNSAQMVVC